MAKTLTQVREQIAKLQRDEERLRRAEAAEVIAKIKVAIEAYGLTPADLFQIAGAGGTHMIAGAGPTSQSKAEPAISGSRKIGLARKGMAYAPYSDGSGNEWGGRGPRPLWLRDALASGRELSEFAVRRGGAGKELDAAKLSAELSSRNKNTVAVKYRDGQNSWSGRGSQPRWLKAALSSGKTLEDFAV